MEELTQLFIATAWRAQSHKWDVGEDGLVEYRDNRVTPKEVCDNFATDYPMFNVLRGEVCRRITNPDSPKPYTWVQLERFI